MEKIDYVECIIPPIVTYIARVIIVLAIFYGVKTYETDKDIELKKQLIEIRQEVDSLKIK